jgi:hypothetical protein
MGARLLQQTFMGIAYMTRMKSDRLVVQAEFKTSGFAAEKDELWRNCQLTEHVRTTANLSGKPVTLTRT